MFDKTEELQAALKKFYLKTIGKNDPELNDFSTFAFGYFHSSFAVLLYELGEEKAKKIVDDKIKQLNAK
jgi:hypothetical protein